MINNTFKKGWKGGRKVSRREREKGSKAKPTVGLHMGHTQHRLVKQCEKDMISPACHQRTFCKHSEGKAGEMVFPLCRATMATEASEGKAGALVLPLCRSTVETEAS